MIAIAWVTKFVKIGWFPEVCLGGSGRMGFGKYLNLGSQTHPEFQRVSFLVVLGAVGETKREFSVHA